MPITVECVGDRVRVYFGDDAEPTFDEVVDPAFAGSIGLYVEAASLTRFSEIQGSMTCGPHPRRRSRSTS